MASAITPYLQKLSEVSGHDAREVMIEGLSAINNGGFNATTFNGKKEDEYLKDIDMKLRINAFMERIKKDNAPDENSENLITTKGIRSVVGPVPFS